MPISDERPPFTWKEWVAIITLLCTIVMAWASINAKLDRVGDRVIDLGASQAAAVTEFRLHVAQPGHAVELERLEQLANRLNNNEAILRDLIRPARPLKEVP